MSARTQNGAARLCARLVVLVGPKGSGKTTIGRILEERLGAHFLDVEAIAKRVLAAAGNTIDEAYARRAFAEIVSAIDREARADRILVIETTAASEATAAFLGELRRRYDVGLARIHARRETCEARIAAREQERQIQVSRELMRAMHERSIALELPCDLEVDNDPAKSADEIIRAFTPLLRGVAAGKEPSTRQ